MTVTKANWLVLLLQATKTLPTELRQRLRWTLAGSGASLQCGRGCLEMTCWNSGKEAAQHRLATDRDSSELRQIEQPVMDVRLSNRSEHLLLEQTTAEEFQRRLLDWIRAELAQS